MSGFSRTWRTTGRRSEGTAALFFLILAATLAAYWPALHGGLLWDDFGHITFPELRSLRGLWRIWSELGATQQYYPLLHSAFWLEHRIWGDSFTGYHLANIVFHAASAFLVVRILRTLEVPGALLAGLIFALHPVAVESVAWISEQKNTLSSVFYLASAYVYLRFCETGLKACATDATSCETGLKPCATDATAVAQPFRAVDYWLAFTLFIGALLTKSVTATLPAALLVVFWWKEGRLDRRRHVQPLLPWFAVAVMAGAFTAWFEHAIIGAQGEDFALTFGERCLLAGRIIWFYLGKVVWPQNLIFIYPRWEIDTAVWWQYLFPAAAIALAVVLGIVAKRPTLAHTSQTASAFAQAPADRRSLGGGWSVGTRGPLAGYLYFCGTLVPALGFVNVYPFRFSYVADHFQYLASLGVIVPLASALAIASARSLPRRRQLAWGLAGVLVIALAGMTWHRSAVYLDAETLYRDTIARNPAAWMAHLNLGIEFAARNRLGEAIDAFEGALRARPGYAEAARTLVLARMKLAEAAADSPDRITEAVAQYDSVLRIDRNHFRAHYNAGTLLMDVPERRTEALQHLESAVKLQPESIEARVNLGVLLADDPSRLEEAMEHLEFALAKRPDLTHLRQLVKDVRSRHVSPQRR